MLVALLSLVRSDCRTIWGFSFHTETLDGECLTFTSCVFHDLTAERGAAILTTANLTVFDSTFLRLTATNQSGAIDLTGAFSFACNRSCFRACLAADYGTAIGAWAVRNEFTCSHSAVVGGGPSQTNEAAIATIYLGNVDTTVCQNLNFSHNRLHHHQVSGHGAAFLCAPDSREWNTVFCTFLRCTGDTIIDSASSSAGIVRLCNFCGNQVSEDRAVIFCRTIGATVNSCIFKNNVYDLARDAAADASMFTLINCVFDGHQASNVADVVFSDNIFDSVTNSLFLVHFENEHCLAEDPTAPLPPEPSRTCTMIAGAVEPIAVNFGWTNPSCTIVTDSFFYQTQSYNGGGIYAAGGGSLSVWDTTFLESSATDGGGIDDSGPDLTVLRCCFRGTTSSASGTAIQGLTTATPKLVSETDFFQCRGTSASSEGTIAVYVAAQCSFDHINVTQCVLPTTGSGTPGYGAIFYTSQSGSTLSLSWSTILGNSGITGVHSLSTNEASISFCNFYDNAFSADYGVLWSANRGMSLDSCVFNNNTNEFSLGGGTILGQYSVVRCVFSGNLPSSDYYDVETENFVNTATVTLWLTHFATEYCPAATPTALASGTPLASFSPAPSGTIEQSPDASGTPEMSPLATPSESCDVVDGLDVTEPMDIGNMVCLHVTHCVFFDLEADYGGGLRVSTGRVYVADSAFVQCSAEDNGGAIQEAGTASLRLVRCCIRETEAWSYGTAIDLRGGTGDKSFSDTNFVATYEMDEDAEGTIYTNIACSCTFLNLNFTECRLDSGNDGFGTAFRFNAANGYWTFSFATVLANNGRNCIDDGISAMGLVDSCNFYGNELSSSYGALYARSSGMNVTNCIFNGNTRDIGRSGSTAKFNVVDCIFSGALPSSAYLNFVSGNVGTTVTASLFQPHFGTYYCPAYAGTPRASPTPDSTLSPPVSGSPSASSVPTQSCFLVATSTGARTQLTMSGCAEVRDSFWTESSTVSDGGAIYVDGPQLIVHDTTFLRTTAGDGGAIYDEGIVSSVLRCCFRETSADSYGLAINIYDNSGDRSICESSFMGCTGTDSGWQGSIYEEIGCELLYQSLNFTACGVASAGESGMGSAIYHYENSGHWVFEYCTVLENGGARCIYTATTAQCTIRESNFYGNSEGTAIVVNQAGHFVDSCIFSDNKEDFDITRSSVNRKFVLSNCVFSGSFPAAAYVDLQSGNIQNSETASFPLFHLETFYCPAETPTPGPPPLETPEPSHTPSPSCVAFDGLTARLSWTTPGCVIVTNAFIYYSYGDMGGAIYVDECSLFASDCTFYDTWSPGNGGAIEDDGEILRVERCCFRDTWTMSERGTAIDLFDSDDVTKTVRDSNFVGCDALHPGVSGTIFLETPAILELEHLNFSGCSIPAQAGGGFGVVFYASKTGGSWLFRYSTVSGITGSSGIHSYTEAQPLVEHCNFYGISLSGSYGILYARTVGFEVNSCNFRDTQREIFLYSSASTTKFRIVDCVFGGSFPSPSACDFTSGNAVNSQTASFPLPLFGTAYCPTGSPTQSAAAFPSDTPFMTSSPVLSSTAAPSRTCTRVTGAVARVSASFPNSDPSCIEVLDSFFYKLHDTHGGGIYIEGGSLFVWDTTFLESDAGDGGGIEDQGFDLSVIRCCFRGTTGRTSGTAIDIWTQAAPKLVRGPRRPARARFSWVPPRSARSITST
jgi:hypothetical protein